MGGPRSHVWLREGRWPKRRSQIWPFMALGSCRESPPLGTWDPCLRHPGAPPRVSPRLTAPIAILCSFIRSGLHFRHQPVELFAPCAVPACRPA